MARLVRCPDCGEDIEVPQGVRDGDRFECPNCAGVILRLREDGDQRSAALVAMASCPSCDEQVEIPEGAKPGDLVRCCGREWRLTFAFDTWALEDPAES